MTFIRTSILTGVTRTAELDVTEDQYEAWLSGALIQDVMPHLPLSHREFLINGSTPAEWEVHMGAEPGDTTPVPFVEVAT